MPVIDVFIVPGRKEFQLDKDDGEVGPNAVVPKYIVHKTYFYPSVTFFCSFLRRPAFRMFLYT